MNTAYLPDLKKVVALCDMPESLLQWILDHSDYKEYQDGEMVVGKDDPIDHLWVILDGTSDFYMDINGNKVYYYSFGNDVSTGGVGGLLPFSRMKTSPGYGYAIGTVKTLRIHKSHFPELEKLNETFTRRLISYMTDRARIFATQQLQQEKVSALGKLSAGIAHELNNPASAINRISKELTKRLIRNFDLTEKLLMNGVNYVHIHQMRKMVEERIATSPVTNKISTLKQLELEEDIRTWLDNHKISRAGELSETFVESGVTIMELEEISNLVESESCSDVLGWLENLVSSQKIINDLDQASVRISNIVGAIKSHVHMDRTGGIQLTNVRDDIENTLILLAHKIKDKNIKVVKDYQDDIPNVEAAIGELNQVWMNLIDNAIYALQKGGEFTIKMYTRSGDLKVHIKDNGQGIPADIIHRIFDPFFTTKKVGEGTGIGLDIVARIIKNHNGDIKVHSIPGNTEFVVCLPVKHVK